MKSCNKCGIEKKESEFYSRSYSCKPCHNFQRKENYIKNKDRELKRNKEYRETHKSEIYAKVKEKYKSNREKYNQKKRDWYSKNKDKRREYMRINYLKNREKISLRHFSNHLKRKYQISYAEYHEMMIKQDGRCEICLSKFGKTVSSKACVDHSHATGKVRGLLCRKCNLTLSLLEDNPHLERAFDYLKR